MPKRREKQGSTARKREPETNALSATPASSSGKASSDWKRDAIAAFKAIAIRLIDREHTTTFLVFMALVIVAIFTLRMPQDAYRELPKFILALIDRSTFAMGVLILTVTVLFAACVVLVAVVMIQRRYYRTEIDRMADAKRVLEELLDPDRPRTFLPQAVVEAVDVGETIEPVARTETAR